MKETAIGILMISKKADLEKAIKGHILASGELIGLYKKIKNK